MKNFLKPTLAAAAFAVLAPLAAAASTISGQMDIGGMVNLGGSDFSTTGHVDLFDPGSVLGALGDFASVSAGTPVALTDIDFTTPGNIWSVGTFSFDATSFANIIDGATKSFTALGTVHGVGYDDTAGVLTFTAQSGQQKLSFSATTVVPVPATGLLLLSGLGGLMVVRRRRRKAA